MSRIINNSDHGNGCQNEAPLTHADACGLEDTTSPPSAIRFPLPHSRPAVFPGPNHSIGRASALSGLPLTRIVTSLLEEDTTHLSIQRIGPFDHPQPAVASPAMVSEYMLYRFA
eukprot:34554-Eustigmatos_ZCMA.PRE.1